VDQCVGVSSELLDNIPVGGSVCWCQFRATRQHPGRWISVLVSVQSYEKLYGYLITLIHTKMVHEI